MNCGVWPRETENELARETPAEEAITTVPYPFFGRKTKHLSLGLGHQEPCRSSGNSEEVRGENIRGSIQSPIKDPLHLWSKTLFC